MRRLLIAAALAVLCTAAAGCDSDSKSSTSSIPSASASAAAPFAAGNTQQICDDIQQLITDSTTRFGAEVTKVLKSAGTASEEANKQALATVKSLFTESAGKLRDEAAKATEADLKAALTAVADKIQQVGAGIRSVDDLQQADKWLDAPELAQANRDLDKFCG